MDKRFIEESFPIQEVSSESSKEKNIRHGHISTLHIWWARRPLASSRATNYAALIPAPHDEIESIKIRNFIVELSKWENSLNKNLINQAKNDILKTNKGIPPKVLDPFSGGGAIPLEALRIGCDVYANDYNPVAVLIEKCTLEYPIKYANHSNKEWAENQSLLAEDVKKWGGWVLNKVKNEIGEFYPNNDDGSIPVGYIWSKTVKCQNPSCGTEIPLMKQFWLVNKKNRKIALKPVIKNNAVDFEILEGINEIPEDFDPSKGTISRSICQCLVCGSSIEAKTIRNLFQTGKSGDKLIAAVFKDPNGKGKTYRLITNNEIEKFVDSTNYLKEKRKKLIQKNTIDPIPDEELPKEMTGCIAPPNYGMYQWGSLFNQRQNLALITFVEKTQELFKKLISEGYDQEYAKAITSYIALAITRQSDYNSTLSVWVSSGEFIRGTFGRQALPVIWDYFELCPWSQATGDWNSAINWIYRVIIHLSQINLDNKSNIVPKVIQSSATSLPYDDNFFDAVFTDPPYYNSVPYADLSDFFYVWLKRSLSFLYPELFATPLTPKRQEITEMSGWDKKRYHYKDKKFFENNLKKSFQEIHRVLKPNGIATIVYAHKTTEGWETLINSLLESGLTVTASWPISTERNTRLRAKSSAALASSIYIVSRKIDQKEIGWLKDIKEEIASYIPQKLDKLWDEGIYGADFFIAAIGSSIEIFGKYEKILNNEGQEIRADKLLVFLRDIVTNYAMKQILHNGDSNKLSPLTKFYLLWRWNYQEVRVPFDEARKLAQSAGIDLSNEWNKGFIEKRGEFINLQGPEKREIKLLENSKELIDTLHYVCLLWKEGKKDEMTTVLKKSGYGKGEALYKVAQAISETLPNSSSEKKMIEGFLAGKDKIVLDMREDDSQTKLV